MTENRLKHAEFFMSECHSALVNIDWSKFSCWNITSYQPRSWWALVTEPGFSFYMNLKPSAAAPSQLQCCNNFCYTITFTICVTAQSLRGKSGHVVRSTVIMPRYLVLCPHSLMVIISHNKAAICTVIKCGSPTCSNNNSDYFCYYHFCVIVRAKNEWGGCRDHEKWEDQVSKFAGRKEKP